MSIDSPFEELYVFSSDEFPELEIQRKWMVPFHNPRLDSESSLQNDFRMVEKEVTLDIVTYLLSIQGKCRRAGSILALIVNYNSLSEAIAHIFVKEKNSIDGYGYGLALAKFNTPYIVNILENYIDHFLKFDGVVLNQKSAFLVLSYLDSVNKTTKAEQYVDRWRKWALSTPESFRNIDKSIELFAAKLSYLEKVAAS